MDPRALEQEIQAAVDGLREQQLYQLGGIEAYVRLLLSDARFEEGTAIALEEALDAILRRENVLSVSDADRLKLLIELCGAFAPERGSSKLIELIERLGPAPMWFSAGADRRVDLHFRALYAIERYYPVPPHTRHPQYLYYIDVLRAHLGYNRYVGYSLVRLLQLLALTVQDPHFETTVKRFPAETLAPVVEFYLSPEQRHAAQGILGEIYSVCSRNQLRKAMADALEEVGASVERFDSHPTIIFEGATIPLNITNDEQARTMSRNADKFKQLVGQKRPATYQNEVSH